ncbi:erg26, C-3 sterol dehydrogenase [Neocucurbitaria cava]|uniref:Erg26, C-3 sterol dehydrogenase n=1 Tax=Neocucurbitaria cava TaxID=798079 RepID=A0A9W8YFC5_9PLEO|nr:erg26, C-3 sterol dehydrogenase [Neocucurbitaria cava]
MYSTTNDSVLVVGGGGFVGYHLTSYFVTNKSFAKVNVMSRKATSSKNNVSGATYHNGDITDEDQLRRVIEETKPAVIIHAASPSPVTGTATEYKQVNIKGTGNLLRCAKDSKHVKAFIFTSSSALAKGAEHLDLSEECMLANEDPNATPYARSKATAELRVLGANNPKLQEYPSWKGYLATAALRLPIVYGTRDETTIPGCLDALSKGQTNMTLGPGDNFWSFCSASNAARAHLLLASALLDPTPKPEHLEVHGEAFNINDGSPHPFWDFARLTWKCAGYNTQYPTPTVRHVPVTLALALSVLLEWTFWIFTLGLQRPYNLGKEQVEYACFTHTYSIEKARNRLEYKPRVDFQREVQKAVEWCIEEGGWREKLAGVKGLKEKA